MRRGFTLLEVLLSLALMALVLSLIQGTYSGAVRSRLLSGAESREVHAATVALERVASELASAFTSNASAPRTLATRFVAGTDLDGWSSLSFVTRLNPLPGTLPGGEAEVGYLVERDDDGVFRLLRRESRDLDGDPEEGGVPYEVLPQVSRFLVQCFDGEEWQEAWDSREREEEPRLPLAVSVELAWGEEGAERVLRTATPIYRARRGSP